MKTKNNKTELWRIVLVGLYVVYRTLYGEMGLWTRPAGMRSELVTHDGVTQPRFMYVASDAESHNDGE